MTSCGASASAVHWRGRLRCSSSAGLQVEELRVDGEQLVARALLKGGSRRNVELSEEAATGAATLDRARRDRRPRSRRRLRCSTRMPTRSKQPVVATLTQTGCARRGDSGNGNSLRNRVAARLCGNGDARRHLARRFPMVVRVALKRGASKEKELPESAAEALKAWLALAPEVGTGSFLVEARGRLRRASLNKMLDRRAQQAGASAELRRTGADQRSPRQGTTQRQTDRLPSERFSRLWITRRRS